MNDQPTTVADLRELLRDSASQDRPVEDWLAVAYPDAAAVVELLPVLRLVPAGSKAQRLLAEHIRYLLGKHIAAALQMLDALEHEHGLTGPLSNQALTGTEARQAVQRLADMTRGQA